MSRPLRYGLLTALALGGVLLYLLALSSSNTQAFARNYPVLLAANSALALLLLGVVVALVLRLARRLRAGRFGARLMARFALAFALMGVVPGALIYVVSMQFLSKSIESWFDVRVDRALEAGLTLGRAALEAQLADLTRQARAIALELAEEPESMQLAALDHARERAGVHEATLLGAGGQLLGTSGTPVAGLVPALPPASALRQVRAQRVFAVIEGDEFSADPDTGLRTRVIVPIPEVLFPVNVGGRTHLARPTTEPGRNERFLQLTQRAPPTVLANAAGLLQGYREYQDLALSRGALRKIYTVTLTLALLLAALAAVASGVLLASSMTAPLLQVAAGTRAVAEGNFRPVREFKGNDELKLLTQSFNAMTRQLSEARNAVEQRSRELESARAFLERVLSNLSAGVLVLDSQYRLVTANYGASRILGLNLASHLGQGLQHVLSPALAPLTEHIAQGFADQQLDATPKESWQKQVELSRTDAAKGAGADALTLLLRGSRLLLEDGPGCVVVFDDITQIISAQRTLAWSEVARRLAHEIKNPLTPIQLAAERLQMKLADKLPTESAAVLTRAVSTIVNQVTAMKRMVDEFREYARLPAARLVALDLNALIAEVAALYGSNEVELALSPELPRILGDSGQLRQVLHNLIGNAREAMAAPGRAAVGRVLIRTEIVGLTDSAPEDAQTPTSPTSTRAVRLSVQDDGPGFPAHILRRAFEPYVTTKPSGTGLGLAMVKKIVDEHDARIELINRSVGAPGATVSVVFRRLVSNAAS